MKGRNRTRTRKAVVRPRKVNVKRDDGGFDRFEQTGSAVFGLSPAPADLVREIDRTRKKIV